MAINQLQPQALWQSFSALNAVPRPSKQEERVRAFMLAFGKEHQLDVSEDAVGNILMRKPATAGKDSRPITLLQAHLDMVHQKNSDTKFDFAEEGIRMHIDGDWVTADGTTLGADNGIGVAAIMAVLADKGNIAHPPLEALFTVDEETGMTGAKGLQTGFLKAKYMLNLDTEEDRELTIGCAGGIDVTATGTYTANKIVQPESSIELVVSGLSGGHSGMDINKGLGNANKLLIRLLLGLSPESYSLAAFDGGGLRNAIPREARAHLSLHDSKAVENLLTALKSDILQEYSTTDPELSITWHKAEEQTSFVPTELSTKLLSALQACPNGIYRMSPDVDGLVQTSNNLARVRISDGSYEVLCLTRSSVDSEKMDEVLSIRSLFELIGATVSTDGDYPGWTPLPQSTLLTTMRNLYVDMFDEQPHVNACHAGLECGLIGKKVPGMEMISFGPNITGAHSPDEQVQISSVQKFWKFFLKALDSL